MQHCNARKIALQARLYDHKLHTQYRERFRILRSTHWWSYSGNRNANIALMVPRIENDFIHRLL